MPIGEIAMLNGFGLCFARLMTSVMVLTGKFGDATSSIFADTTIDTGARSRS